MLCYCMCCGAGFLNLTFTTMTPSAHMHNQKELHFLHRSHKVQYALEQENNTLRRLLIPIPRPAKLSFGPQTTCMANHYCATEEQPAKADHFSVVWNSIVYLCSWWKKTYLLSWVIRPVFTDLVTVSDCTVLVIIIVNYLRRQQKDLLWQLEVMSNEEQTAL